MKKRKIKNIAILVWSLNSGGAERAAGLLSKYLAEFYNVYLFLYTTENIIYEYGGQIIHLSNDAEYREYYLEQYKKKYAIDCAISFLDDSNILNIKTKGRERVIVSERCAMSPVPSPFYHYNYQKKMLYKKADAVVSVAAGIQQDLINLYDVSPQKIETIYNFIHQDKIKSEAERSISDPEILVFLQNAKVFVNIGRLDEQKNQKRLIRQFSLLYKERNDVRLLIIGSGMLKKELEELIIELDLSRVVKLVPYCKNPFPYLKRADAYVMASHYEGLPNAILEAMCLEIPVIAVDCLSGPRELLSGNCDYGEPVKTYQLCARGILVTDSELEDDGKTHYFKDALLYFLENEQFATQVREAERLYMEAYMNENIVNQWIKVIEGEQEVGEEKVEKEELDSSKKIVIYGAGKFGKKVFAQLKKHNLDVYAFAVTSKAENPSEIEGIPVRMIEELRPYREEVTIIMGVGYVNQQSQVVKKLTELGFENIHFMRLVPEQV